MNSYSKLFRLVRLCTFFFFFAVLSKTDIVRSILRKKWNHIILYLQSMLICGVIRNCKFAIDNCYSVSLHKFDSLLPYSEERETESSTFRILVHT